MFEDRHFASLRFSGGGGGRGEGNIPSALPNNPSNALWALPFVLVCHCGKCKGKQRCETWAWQRCRSCTACHSFSSGRGRTGLGRDNWKVTISWFVWVTVYKKSSRLIVARWKWYIDPLQISSTLYADDVVKWRGALTALNEFILEFTALATVWGVNRSRILSQITCQSAWVRFRRLLTALP